MPWRLNSGFPKLGQLVSLSWSRNFFHDYLMIRPARGALLPWHGATSSVQDNRQQFDQALFVVIHKNRYSDSVPHP